MGRGGASYTDLDKALYLRFRRVLGHSVAVAAREVGATASWGYGLERKLAADATERNRLLLFMETIGDAQTSNTGSRGLVRAPTSLSKADMCDDARRALDDFEYFRVAIMGRRCKPWAVDAAHQVRLLWESPDKTFCVVNIAPGVGKTTLLHDVCAWLTCSDRTIRGALGHAALKSATKYTMRLRAEFDRTRPARPSDADRDNRGAVDAIATMVGWYGRFRPPTGHLWRADAFQVLSNNPDLVAQKEATWSAASMDSEEILGDRLNLVCFDDAATPGRSKSELVREQDHQHWDRIIENRLEPGGLLLEVGQRVHPLDLHRYCLDKTVELEMPGSDEPEKFSKYFHITYPAHDDERCEGDHGKDAKAWPDGCLLDPGALNHRTLMATKTADVHEFELVYQQNDTSISDALCKKLWIDGGRDQDGEVYPGCLDKDRGLGVLPPAELLKGCVSYATVDPSSSNYWAVQWWLYVPSLELRVLVDMIRRKMKAPDLLENRPGTLIYTGIMQDWQLRAKFAGVPISAWVIEQNAAQRYLLQYEWLQVWRRQHRGVRIIGHDTHKNKTDPKKGVGGALPRLYRHGLVRLPWHPSSQREVQPFITELCTWPWGGTQDLVMAEWMGEFNLPGLRRQGVAKEPKRRPRPTWMKGQAKPNYLERMQALRDDD